MNIIKLTYDRIAKLSSNCVYPVDFPIYLIPFESTIGISICISLSLVSFACVIINRASDRLSSIFEYSDLLPGQFYRSATISAQRAII